MRTPYQTTNLPASPAIYVIRNGIGYYRSFRASYGSRKNAVRPAPPRITRALNILFAVAVLALASTYFQPENIFALTNGRVQTTTDVLFNRLASLRDLTPRDERLKAKFKSRDSRLLYFTYGPYVLADCPFCTSASPYDYFLYAVPSILTPHVLNAAVVGLVTSKLFSGPEAARWRILGTCAAALLGVAELYVTGVYDYSSNASSTQLSEIYFFYWRMRLYRALAIAAVDALLGWVLWLSATGRFFVRQLTLPEKVEALSRAADVVNFRLQAVGSVRNTVIRDEVLRDVMAAYWGEEKGLFEEREVVDAMKVAMSRTDLQQLSLMADQKSRSIVGPWPALAATPPSKN